MKKGSKRSKYTAEEHKARHAKAVGLTLEEFDRYLVVQREGKRWISVPRVRVKREEREARKSS